MGIIEQKSSSDSPFEYSEGPDNPIKAVPIPDAAPRPDVKKPESTGMRAFEGISALGRAVSQGLSYAQARRARREQ